MVKNNGNINHKNYHGLLALTKNIKILINLKKESVFFIINCYLPRLYRKKMN